MTSASSSPDVAAEVLGWLRQYLRLNESTRLTPQTMVNFELGVDGDDGVDLLSEFGRRFDVDVESFPYARYFGPEAGASPLALISTAWRWVTARRSQSLDPLRVCDLIAMVERTQRSATGQ